MRIIKALNLPGAILSAIFGMIICIISIIILYIYLIVTSETVGIINVIVYIVLLIADGPLFLLHQYLFSVLFLQKRQMEDNVIANTIALGSLLFFIMVIFFLPIIFEIEPFMILVSKTTVRDDITLFFCQASASIGAFVCFLFSIFRKKDRM